MLARICFLCLDDLPAKSQKESHINDSILQKSDLLLSFSQEMAVKKEVLYRCSALLGDQGILDSDTDT